MVNQRSRILPSVYNEIHSEGTLHFSIILGWGPVSYGGLRASGSLGVLLRH